MSVLADHGLHCYVGAPQFGKSSAALWEARRAARELGWHLLVVDSIGNMPKLPGRVDNDGPPGAAETAIIRRAGSARGGATAWTPPSAARLEWLLGALAAAKLGVVLLVDEWSLWITSKRPQVPTLLYLCRAWAHVRVRVYMTTQNASGDIPRAVRDCMPRWSVFGMTVEAAHHVCGLLALSDDIRARVPALVPGQRFVIDPNRRVALDVVPKRAALPNPRSRKP